MHIVPRIVIGSDQIVSTNAVDPPDFDAGFSYALGDRVKDPATYLEYESRQAVNVGNTPATSPAYWIEIGIANSRRVVDGLLSGRSEHPERLSLTLDLGEFFTSVVVFNVEGVSVTLSISEGGSEIFTRTIQMVRTDDATNIWEYFFTPPDFKTVAIFPSVPGFAGSEVTLTVEAPNGTARAGEAIFGYGTFIGNTMEGSGPRFKDFSTKDQNDFGEFVVTERGFARGAEYEVALNPLDTDRILRVLEANRARVCAFFPADEMEHYGLTVAGFFKNFEPNLVHRGITPVSIEIEGVQNA